MPPGIFAYKPAALGLDILATLNARLALGDGDTLEPRIPHSEQWTLATERFIFNNIHLSNTYFPTTKLRINESNTKEKKRFLCFELPNESNFGKASITK
jgi:hypothetical protein